MAEITRVSGHSASCAALITYGMHAGTRPLCWARAWMACVIPNADMCLHLANHVADSSVMIQAGMQFMSYV
jgi:hypothetical protein